MNKSEELAKLWPEYFKEPSKEVKLLMECVGILEEIERRYKVECRPTVTRPQITKISRLLTKISK